MADYPKFQLSKFLAGSRDYQVVIRTDDADELIEAMTKIKPLVKKLESLVVAAPKKPAAQDAGMCDIHHTPMKLNKNGKPYHLDKSRSEGDQFCNGYGFPNEKAEWKDNL